MTIRTIPAKGGGFIAAVYDHFGNVVCDARAFTRWEAQQAVRKLAREHGVKL